MITLTEQVLAANGIECDSKISKISEEQIREIIEVVRRLRKRRSKKKMVRTDSKKKSLILFL
ncbi:MAG TPA: hypothetical protein VFZ67_08180 [Nitrososphaera sp.]